MTNLVFIYRSRDYSHAIQLFARLCCIIAGAMTNHRHVGGPSLAPDGPRVLTPAQQLRCSALAPPATAALPSWQETGALGYVSGTFGRYRVRLAQERPRSHSGLPPPIQCVQYRAGGGLVLLLLDRPRPRPLRPGLRSFDRRGPGGRPGSRHLPHAIGAHGRGRVWLLQRPGIRVCSLRVHPRPGPGAGPRLDRSSTPLQRSAHPAVAGDCPIRQTPRAAVPDWLLFPDLEGPPRRLEPLPGTCLTSGFVRILYRSHRGVCAALRRR